jgi:hypothetical protein
MIHRPRRSARPSINQTVPQREYPTIDHGQLLLTVSPEWAISDVSCWMDPAAGGQDP